MVKVAIIGATGYTGLELIRLLEFHPRVEIITITSRKEVEKSLKDFVNWSGKYQDLVFEPPVVEKISKKVDLAFLCVPSGEAQEFSYKFLKAGVKVVDFSADFRFKDVSTYESTYKISHNYPELCQKEAVYGLTEIFRNEVKNAKLIANPGCYPTSILLPLIPLLKEGLIEAQTIIADSKSGTSGAGRKSDNYYSFCEVNEDFKAYKIASHRHNPEIEEKLTLTSGKEVKVVFTPHLLPINRGIFSTIYVKLKCQLNTAWGCLKEFYQDSTFVEILPVGRIPRISEVRGTNLCKISLFEDSKRGWGIITSVIDNLIKGASGQAIQNLNVMFGLPEDLGLPKSPHFV